jgi:YycE-like protein
VEVRVARHTERLGEVVAFYRDGIGLTEIGGFESHDGYEGVFLAVPGTAMHLEFTAGGEHAAPEAHPESLLVLYLVTMRPSGRSSPGSTPIRWPRRTPTGRTMA